jgi:hypothetical protein
LCCWLQTMLLSLLRWQNDEVQAVRLLPIATTLQTNLIYTSSRPSVYAWLSDTTISSRAPAEGEPSKLPAACGLHNAAPACASIAARPPASATRRPLRRTPHRDGTTSLTADIRGSKPNRPLLSVLSVADGARPGATERLHIDFQTCSKFILLCSLILVRDCVVPL